MDSRLRKTTREVGRSPDTSLYERLVSHLESQIIFLEDELRKKDILIEKLIDKNLDVSKKSETKCSCITSKSSSNTDDNTIGSSVPKGLIDFQFDESSDEITVVAQRSSNQNSDARKKEKKEKRQNIFICGDSLLNGVDGDGISSKDHCVVVKSFGGSTSFDMIDYIKPTARKKPDKIIVHVGTNDITKKIENTTENLQKIIKTVHDLSPETQVCFSELCLRNDLQGGFSNVKRKNDELRKFCSERNLALIENGNVDDSCLAKKKLHMNPKGLKRLALNLKGFLGKR